MTYTLKGGCDAVLSHRVQQKDVHSMYTIFNIVAYGCRMPLFLLNVLVVSFLIAYHDISVKQITTVTAYR